MAAQAFIDPFRAANYLRGEQLFVWDFLSLDHNTVAASSGLAIAQTCPYLESDNLYDLVVLNASWAPERFRSRALQSWLRGMDSNGVVLAGLDTGACGFGSAE